MKKNKHGRQDNIMNANPNQKQKGSKVENGVFVYSEALTVGQLAEKLNIKASDIIKTYFLKGQMLTINTILSDDMVGEICLEHNFDVKKEEVKDVDDIEGLNIEDDEASLVERAPVVTVMGHVDHGKTTLIDAIRNSNVVATEAGGISQAIGAYQKEYKGKKITIIDTPGHKAFAAMRARGASVTDIVVLIVAADDSVMPQTVEAIDHAKAAGVPIIVAVNKMDKPGANPEKVLTDLMNYDIIAEKYGGSNICVEISAKTGEGIEELLENIVLQSEMLELKANPNRFAIGTVLEAKLDKGEGPKATLLIQNGTLKTGDYVVVGTTFGKVRRMNDDYNHLLKEAGPSTPVSVIGLNDVPLAGDKFVAMSDERLAKDIANKRRIKKEMAERKTESISTMDQLFEKVAEGEITQVNIIIKADSTGSAEALKASLENIKSDDVKINVIKSSAGAITESDILLANASHAIIYGFNVRPDAVIKQKAKEEKVEIRLSEIIYQLLEEVEDLVKGLKKAVITEEYRGQAEVRQTIKSSKIGTIAGCYVTDGVIPAGSLIRLLRDGKVVFKGKILGLKRFKDDAKEVKQGFECGISIEGFNDIHENDIIEAYALVEK